MHLGSQPHGIHSARLAFVLNQNQHWYTLRRFGKNGHWFNLDSTKPSPQWISKTYLGMFLQQAEQEGQLMLSTRLYYSDES